MSGIKLPPLVSLSLYEDSQDLTPPVPSELIRGLLAAPEGTHPAAHVVRRGNSTIVRLNSPRRRGEPGGFTGTGTRSSLEMTGQGLIDAVLEGNPAALLYLGCWRKLAVPIITEPLPAESFWTIHTAPTSERATPRRRDG